VENISDKVVRHLLA